MRILAILVLAVALTGCARKPLEATAERYVINANPEQAKAGADAHCARYGKAASYVRTEPYRFNQTITTFACN